MVRIFFFVVPNLNYQKQDLNIPVSENRLIIGQLSHMITNSIFLSHSLRKDIIIRIFVQKPIPHVYQIKSQSIRFLGPELRSFASLILKTENIIAAKSLINENEQINWHELNPGLFMSFCNNLFVDIDKEVINPISIICFDRINKTEKKKNKSMVEIFTNMEEILNELCYDVNSLLLIFKIDNSNDLLIPDSLKKMVKKNVNLKISVKISLPNILAIINIILDKINF